ncbi:hypothetical protein Agub_g15745, partial [Astrephomene gubernaculifera]
DALHGRTVPEQDRRARGERALREVVAFFHGRAALPSLQWFAAGPRQELRVEGLAWRLPQPRHPGSSRLVLSGVSARFRPSQMTAVMGPSGCGKTSLLGLMAGRLPYWPPSDGRLLVNGMEVTDPRVLQRITGFVPQDDIVSADLTVRENLEFSAALRMPRRGGLSCGSSSCGGCGGGCGPSSCGLSSCLPLPSTLSLSSWPLLSQLEQLHLPQQQHQHHSQQQQQQQALMQQPLQLQQQHLTSQQPISNCRDQEGGGGVGVGAVGGNSATANGPGLLETRAAVQRPCRRPSDGLASASPPPTCGFNGSGDVGGSGGGGAGAGSSSCVTGYNSSLSTAGGGGGGGGGSSVASSLPAFSSGFGSSPLTASALSSACLDATAASATVAAAAAVPTSEDRPSTAPAAGTSAAGGGGGGPTHLSSASNVVAGGRMTHCSSADRAAAAVSTLVAEPWQARTTATAAASNYLGVGASIVTRTGSRNAPSTLTHCSSASSSLPAIAPTSGTYSRTGSRNPPPAGILTHCSSASSTVPVPDRGAAAAAAAAAAPSSSVSVSLAAATAMTVSVAATAGTAAAAAAERRRVVELVLDMMSLKGLQDARVGSVEARGISGGQRKRVNIGLELVARPSLLLLDEPTSGLDASCCSDVLRSLSDLAAAGGVNVVAVVHQPRHATFMMFDEVLLLGVTGCTVYHGPPNEAVSYFTRVLEYTFPQHESVADTLLDIIAGKRCSAQYSASQLPDRWAREGEAWVASLPPRDPKCNNRRASCSGGACGGNGNGNADGVTPPTPATATTGPLLRPPDLTQEVREIIESEFDRLLAATSANVYGAGGGGGDRVVPSARPSSKAVKLPPASGSVSFRIRNAATSPALSPAASPSPSMARSLPPLPPPRRPMGLAHSQLLQLFRTLGQYGSDATALVNEIVYDTWQRRQQMPNAPAEAAVYATGSSLPWPHPPPTSGGLGPVLVSKEELIQALQRVADGELMPPPQPRMLSPEVLLGTAPSAPKPLGSVASTMLEALISVPRAAARALVHVASNARSAATAAAAAAATASAATPTGAAAATAAAAGAGIGSVGGGIRPSMDYPANPSNSSRLVTTLTSIVSAFGSGAGGGGGGASATGMLAASPSGHMDGQGYSGGGMVAARPSVRRSLLGLVTQLGSAAGAGGGGGGTAGRSPLGLSSPGPSHANTATGMVADGNQVAGAQQPVGLARVGIPASSSTASSPCKSNTPLLSPAAPHLLAQLLHPAPHAFGNQHHHPHREPKQHQQQQSPLPMHPFMHQQHQHQLVTPKDPNNRSFGSGQGDQQQDQVRLTAALLSPSSSLQMTQSGQSAQPALSDQPTPIKSPHSTMGRTCSTASGVVDIAAVAAAAVADIGAGSGSDGDGGVSCGCTGRLLSRTSGSLRSRNRSGRRRSESGEAGDGGREMQSRTNSPRRSCRSQSPVAAPGRSLSPATAAAANLNAAAASAVAAAAGAAAAQPQSYAQLPTLYIQGGNNSHNKRQSLAHLVIIGNIPESETETEVGTPTDGTGTPVYSSSSIFGLPPCSPMPFGNPAAHSHILSPTAGGSAGSAAAAAAAASTRESLPYGRGGDGGGGGGAGDQAGPRPAGFGSLLGPNAASFLDEGGAFGSFTVGMVDSIPSDSAMGSPAAVVASLTPTIGSPSWSMTRGSAACSSSGGSRDGVFQSASRHSAFPERHYNPIHGRSRLGGGAGGAVGGGAGEAAGRAGSTLDAAVRKAVAEATESEQTDTAAVESTAIVGATATAAPSDGIGPTEGGISDGGGGGGASPFSRPSAASEILAQHPSITVALPDALMMLPATAPSPFSAATAAAAVEAAEGAEEATVLLLAAAPPAALLASHHSSSEVTTGGGSQEAVVLRARPASQPSLVAYPSQPPPSLQIPDFAPSGDEASPGTSPTTRRPLPGVAAAELTAAVAARNNGGGGSAESGEEGDLLHGFGSELPRSVSRNDGGSGSGSGGRVSPAQAAASCTAMPGGGRGGAGGGGGGGLAMWHGVGAANYGTPLPPSPPASPAQFPTPAPHQEQQPPHQPLLFQLPRPSSANNGAATTTTTASTTIHGGPPYQRPGTLAPRSPLHAIRLSAGNFGSLLAAATGADASSVPATPSRLGRSTVANAAVRQSGGVVHNATAHGAPPSPPRLPRQSATTVPGLEGLSGGFATQRMAGTSGVSGGGGGAAAAVFFNEGGGGRNLRLTTSAKGFFGGSDASGEQHSLPLAKIEAQYYAGAAAAAAAATADGITSASTADAAAATLEPPQQRRQSHSGPLATPFRIPLELTRKVLYGNRQRNAAVAAQQQLQRQQRQSSQRQQDEQSLLYYYDMGFLDPLMSSSYSGFRTAVWPSWLSQMRTFARRAALQSIRACWPLSVWEVCLLLLAALVIGLNQGTRWGPTSVPGHVIMAMLCLAVLAVVQHLRTFSSNRLVLHRERSAGLSVTAYTTARCLTDMPWVIIAPAAFTLPYYVLIVPRAPFLSYYIVSLGVWWWASGLSYLVTVFPFMPPTAAPTVAVLITLIFGAFLNGASAPSLASARNGSWFLKVLLGLSYNRWALEALEVSELDRYMETHRNIIAMMYRDKGTCGIDKQLVDDGNNSKLSASEALSFVQLFESFGSGYCNAAWRADLIALFGLGLALRVLALLALKYDNRIRRAADLVAHAWHVVSELGSSSDWRQQWQQRWGSLCGGAAALDAAAAAAVGEVGEEKGGCCELVTSGGGGGGGGGNDGDAGGVAAADLVVSGGGSNVPYQI